MSFHGADLVTEGRVRQPSNAPCTHCGAKPTADVDFLDKRGGLTTTFEGPFCRDCGLAVFRSATASTLSRGWWGLTSFFATPFVAGANILSRRRVARLSSPQMPTEGRTSMPVGRSLWLRWEIIGALLPIVVAAAVVGVIRVNSDRERQQVASYIGKCVQFSIPAGALVGKATIVDCTGPHDGRIASVFAGSCPPADPSIIVPEARTTEITYCVDPGE